MAIARRCDRCGKYYDHYKDISIKPKCTTSKVVNGVGFLYIDKADEREWRVIYDLCPECMNQLIKWAEKIGDTNEEKI